MDFSPWTIALISLIINAESIRYYLFHKYLQQDMICFNLNSNSNLHLNLNQSMSNCQTNHLTILLSQLAVKFDPIFDQKLF